MLNMFVGKVLSHRSWAASFCISAFIWNVRKIIGLVSSTHLGEKHVASIMMYGLL